MQEITPQEKSIRQKLKDDFFHYSKKCLKIRTKDGRIQPLKLNQAQIHIHDKLEEQLSQTGKVRALILKGRQQGCSTYVAARYFWKITHRKGVRGFILTHLEEATRNIYKIVQRFFENCPDIVCPNNTTSNAKELVFDKLDSGYRIGTAKSSGTGRSDTLQYFHGSEVAYWANAKDHVAGILQAVPNADNTEIILESTSDGASGLFYEMCLSAHKGQSEYQVIFTPWFWQDEYHKSCDKKFNLTAEEKEYKNIYKLNNQQINWRRSKIAELGSVWTFRREYPATLEEAFHSDKPGALWTRDVLDQNRIDPSNTPDMLRIVIAIDPATTSNKNSDETGIIVAGLGTDGHGYVLEDISGKYTPSQWASVAIKAYYKYQADRVIAETNQGGDMVTYTIRTADPNIPFKSVHASRGKRIRAEPIAALDERGRIHHVGTFPKLEDQMCQFEAYTTSHSPDRVDARVWALVELMLSSNPACPKLWRG